MEKNLTQLKQELKELEQLRLKLYGQEAVDNYEKSKIVKTGEKKKNKSATNAFITSLISLYMWPVGIISLIQSIFALKKSKKLDGAGKKLSIAGIVVSSIAIIATVVLLIIIKGDITNFYKLIDKLYK